MALIYDPILCAFKQKEPIVGTDLSGVTTANIAESTDKKYITNAEETAIGTIASKAPINNAALTGTTGIDRIQLNVNATPATNAEGLIQWNATDGTVDLGMDGGVITQQIGQELFIKVINKTASTILNGTPVYFNGRLGNRPKIEPARSDVQSTAMVMGVTTQDILADDEGFITSFGYVRQIKTNYSGDGDWGTTWVAGNKLYTSKTIAGQLTNIEPSVPHHADIVGCVGIVGGTGVGSILININRHYTMQELSDVNGTPLVTDGQVATWHNSTALFDFDKNINDYAKLDQSTPQTFAGGKPIFQGIQFNTNPAVGAWAEGKMYYDTLWKTMAVDIDSDITLQLGQEEQAYCYNGTVSPLVVGNIVYIAGAFNGYPSIALADSTDISKSFVVGVVATASIAAGGYGMVTIRGHVNQLNTSSWTAGTSLYLGTSGNLTPIPPSAGSYDVSIGKVMIQDASNGRVYVNIRQLENLTDLGDVTIASPTTDQVLRYNGTEWVNGSAVTSSASIGIEFFPDDTTIVPAGNDSDYPIKTLSKVPITTAEVVDAITMNNNTVLYGTYIYDTAMGRTAIDGGVWTFAIYAGVSASADITSLKQNINRARPLTGTLTTTGTGTTRTATASGGIPFAIANVDVGGTIDSDSFVRTTTGYFRILSRVSDTEVTIETPSTYTNQAGVAASVHKRLFQVTTGEINNVATSPLFIGLQLYTIMSAQPAYVVEANDKIATALFGTSDGNRTIYFAHNGTTRYSHFQTPLITMHNNLAGLNGGTGSGLTGEYYHLTSAQHTIATQAATTSLSGYLTNTDWNTFNGKQDALGFTAVPTTRTVNGHALTDNVSVSASDVGLGSVTNESKATMFASPTFTGSITAPVIKPATDSTSAVKITKADGTTAVMTVDTTNSKVAIGTTISAYALSLPVGGMTITGGGTIDFGQGDGRIIGLSGSPYGVKILAYNGSATTEALRITGTGVSIGIGGGATAPTASLHLKAGTATAGTAPLKLTAGTNLTTAETGAVEFDGSNLYYTTSAPARKTVAAREDTPVISSGTSAPATTPAKVGDIFVDTTNKKLYFATGTGSSSDWTIAN